MRSLCLFKRLEVTEEGKDLFVSADVDRAGALLYNAINLLSRTAPLLRLRVLHCNMFVWMGWRTRDLFVTADVDRGGPASCPDQGRLHEQIWSSPP